VNKPLALFTRAHSSIFSEILNKLVCWCPATQAAYAHKFT